MTTNRTIHDDTIADIVRQIEPNWTVEEQSVAPAGGHITHFLTIETPTGTRRCVLKATPEESTPVCDDEARLLAILDEHTELPVPTVLGVIDEDPALPTPLFLATELPGDNRDRTALPEFAEAAIEQLARSTGRHLARLHEFRAVDEFGFVGVDPDRELAGGRPSDAPETIVVEQGADSWAVYLDGERDRILDSLEDSQFADLVPTIRPGLGRCVDALGAGPEPEPVIARIDQSLDNQVIDSDTAAVTGLLDWEFCVAATPAYDLAFVVDSLAGGHLTLLPDMPDYRPEIREALLAGYRDVGDEAVVERFRAGREQYELLRTAHKLLTFGWFEDIAIVEVTEEEKNEAVTNLRTRVEELTEAVEGS